MRKTGNIVFISIQALLPFLVFTLLVTSTDPLIPIIRTKIRYFLPIYVFMILFIFGNIGNFIDLIKRKGVNKNIYRGIIAFVIFAVMSVSTASCIVLYQNSIKYISKGNNLFYELRHIVNQINQQKKPIGTIYQSRASRIKRVQSLFNNFNDCANFQPKTKFIPGDIVVSLRHPSEIGQKSDILWQQIDNAIYRLKQYTVYYASGHKKEILRTTPNKSLFGKQLPPQKQHVILSFSPNEYANKFGAESLVEYSIDFTVSDVKTYRFFFHTYYNGGEEPDKKKIIPIRMKDSLYNISGSFENINISEIAKMEIICYSKKTGRIIINDSKFDIFEKVEQIQIPKYVYRPFGILRIM